MAPPLLNASSQCGKQRLISETAISPCHLKKSVRRHAGVCRADTKASRSTAVTTAVIDAPSNGTAPAPAPTPVPAPAPPPQSALAEPGSMAVALAAKVTAARELARRLSEEKAALGSGKSIANMESMKKAAENASVAAAEAAARADALARALKRAETSRDTLQRLKAENEALRELLMEYASDKDAARVRLQGLLERFVGGVLATPAPPAPPTVLPPGPPAVAQPTVAPPAPAPATEVKVAAKAAAPATVAPPPEVARPVEPQVEVVTADVVLEPPALPVPPPAPPRPTITEIRKAAAAALAARTPVFTLPASPVPLSSTIKLYYNRAASPLPPSRQLQLKAGLNKWETIVVMDMTRAVEFETLPSADWWVAEFPIPGDVFRIDYVVLDGERGGVDNNGGRDFSLPLLNPPTEAQVAEQRYALLLQVEEARRAMLQKEEERLWREVENEAAVVAAAAREVFRVKRKEERYEAARAVVAERRRPALFDLPAAIAVGGVYGWVSGPPKPGVRTLLAYNKASGPLARAAGVIVHVGIDGWWNKATTPVPMSPLPRDEWEAYQLGARLENWVGAWVDVPYSAALVDFVFSDTDQRAWDNNRSLDFHTRVATPASGEDLVEMVVQALLHEAGSKDKEDEDRAAKRAARKLEEKACALRKRRAARQEYLYTVPLTPQAGQTVEVYYKSDEGPLRGRPDIFVRGSWNRWSWTRQSDAVVQRMERTLPGSMGFFKATIQVPKEAWGMDLVFSDSESATGGSFVDNNGGLDYHIPVQGGPPKTVLSVVHIAVEMAPIAKVGGMGDVVTALARAVQEQGHTVEVVVPKYDCMDYAQVKGLKQEGTFKHDGTTVRVWRGQVEELNTTFLEPENGMFWVGTIYGKANDAQRFAFFCTSALAYLRSYNRQPSIVHCHDWQSAHVAWGDRGSARCVFTIHNLSYGADLIGRAMAACQVATTVSPTYAREISGSPPIASHLSKLYGVLNGIDQDIWDPAEDPFLPIRYNSENTSEGKAAARKELRKRLNLADLDVPVVGCVTRLVAQKGIHLIKHAAHRTLERGGQFVLLGSAPDPRVQGEFNALRDQLTRQYSDRAGLIFQYDEPLSHLIYAGCDLFLVPSMFEPCGLTQMIAMRYGAVPVVRKTGGLVDTVFDVDHDVERAAAAGLPVNGFSFEGSDTPGMDYALNRALSQWYNNRPWFRALKRSNMTIDWSWNSPALDYIEIYYRALR